jgi:hypothetical protein
VFSCGSITEVFCFPPRRLKQLFFFLVLNTWKYLECGAGEDYLDRTLESRGRGISYIQQKEGGLIELVTSCGGTVL